MNSPSPWRVGHPETLFNSIEYLTFNRVPDNEGIDYFQSTLVGGTSGVDATGFGGSGRVVEYLFGFLNLNDSLQLVSPISRCDEEPLPAVCSWGELTPPSDWEVATIFGLHPAWNFQELFGNVTLTYRDSQPPPPIPLPGAMWFMLSALFATGWLGSALWFR